MGLVYDGCVLILALDTTTRGGSVAVTDDDRLLAERAGDASRTHTERLPAEIELTLADAGLDIRAVELLVVASGPGAFTGLRIGLAAMQGLAMTLQRPIVGVSALDALALTALRAAPATTAAWMDASRGEVFHAVYRPVPGLEPPWEQTAAPASSAPDAIVTAALLDRTQPAQFIGDGARRYAELIRATSPLWTVSDETPLLAPALAWLGQRLAAAGHAGPPHALQPLYVRRPDVEIERDRLAEERTSGQAPQ